MKFYLMRWGKIQRKQCVDIWNVDIATPTLLLYKRKSRRVFSLNAPIYMAIQMKLKNLFAFLWVLWFNCRTKKYQNGKHNVCVEKRNKSATQANNISQLYYLCGLLVYLASLCCWDPSGKIESISLLFHNANVLWKKPLPSS